MEPVEPSSALSRRAFTPLPHLPSLLLDSHSAHPHRRKDRCAWPYPHCLLGRRLPDGTVMCLPEIRTAIPTAAVSFPGGTECTGSLYVCRATSSTRPPSPPGPYSRPTKPLLAGHGTALVLIRRDLLFDFEASRPCWRSHEEERCESWQILELCRMRICSSQKLCYALYNLFPKTDLG